MRIALITCFSLLLMILLANPASPALTLPPDRPVMMYGNYLGGNESLGGWDKAFDITVDAEGNCFVVGVTNADNFPAEDGAYSSHQGGGTDAFVAKFNSSGRGFEWGTYLGGDGEDSAFGVSVDEDGYVYVTGETSSANFPRTMTGISGNEPRGGKDVFVVKLSPDGKSLEKSILMGGDRNDAGQAIEIMGDGSILVMGVTSPGTGFPVVNPLVSSVKGAGCGFVAVISPGWSFFKHSSLVSWAGKSIGITMFLSGVCDIAVDKSGNAYITGTVRDDTLHVVNPQQGQNGGYEDAFLAKINAGGGYSYSTYFGGSLRDYGTSISLSADGSVYITGMTQSPDLPGADPGQSTYQGFDGDGRPPLDCFVAKFNRLGTLEWSRYVGGSKDDYAFAIDADPFGNPYVTGYTDSNDFPILKGSSNANGTSSEDVFVFKLDGDDGNIAFSSTFFNFGKRYVDASDRGYGIVVDSNLSAHFCGWTGAQFQYITHLLDQPNTAISQMLGRFDAFILKMSDKIPVITEVSRNYASVNVSWAPPLSISDPPPDGYIVRYGQNRSTLESLEILPPDAWNAQVPGLQPGVYYFRVTAVYPGDIQATSLDETFSVQEVEIEPPGDLRAIVVNGNVHLSWSAVYEISAEDILGYRIYRGIEPGQLGELADVDKTHYDDLSPLQEDHAFYAVTMLTPWGETSMSEEISISTSVIIETGSTVNSPTLDEERSEIRFILSGNPGTQGSATVWIPKDMITDPDGIRAYLDGDSIPHRLSEVTGHYRIWVDYVHSEHVLLIKYGIDQAFVIIALFLITGIIALRGGAGQ